MGVVPVPGHLFFCLQNLSSFPSLPGHSIAVLLAFLGVLRTSSDFQMLGSANGG